MIAARADEANAQHYFDCDPNAGLHPGYNALLNSGISDQIFWHDKTQARKCLDLLTKSKPGIGHAIIPVRTNVSFTRVFELDSKQDAQSRLPAPGCVELIKHLYGSNPCLKNLHRIKLSSDDDSSLLLCVTGNNGDVMIRSMVSGNYLLIDTYTKTEQDEYFNKYSSRILLNYLGSVIGHIGQVINQAESAMREKNKQQKGSK